MKNIVQEIGNIFADCNNNKYDYYLKGNSIHIRFIGEDAYILSTTMMDLFNFSQALEKQSQKRNKDNGVWFYVGSINKIHNGLEIETEIIGMEEGSETDNTHYIEKQLNRIGYSLI